MIKILILYFSGTGNTEFVSRYIKKHLTSEKYEITLSSIELFNKENISQYDTLFFGFPVYAFDIPRFIQIYIEDIPVTTTKSVFIFCTKAFLSGIAIKHASEIFEKQGYIPCGYADVSMPGSDGLAFLKKDSKTVHKMVNKNYSELEEVDKMIKRSKVIMKSFQENSLKRYCVRPKSTIINSLASRLLGGVFHILEEKMKRKFWADENCIRCLKCEQICPAKNIKVNKEGVLFGENCYLCMRCLHQCPKEAIQIGTKTIGKHRWKGPLGDYNP